MTTKVSSSMINQAGNINYTAANVTLGPIANIHITGGTSGQVLTTDGSGNLSFATASAGGGSNAYITGYSLVFGG